MKKSVSLSCDQLEPSDLREQPVLKIRWSLGQFSISCSPDKTTHTIHPSRHLHLRLFLLPLFCLHLTYRDVVLFVMISTKLAPELFEKY